MSPDEKLRGPELTRDEWECIFECAHEGAVSWRGAGGFASCREAGRLVDGPGSGCERMNLRGRFNRWLQHRRWHVQYPGRYWRTNGDRSDPNDFIRCPFCGKRYPAELGR